MFLLDALTESFYMLWEVLWPLILGFGLSAVVQAVVSHRSMSRLLGDDSAKSLSLAALFGIASSSCSYAAVALARSIFQKGASFASAMVFELASTNLVVELGIILVVLLGWQFAAAEYAGGIIMVIILAVIFRVTLKPRLVELAHQQAERGLAGKMEGHAAMDMSLAEGPLVATLFSRQGFTAVSHYFVMDWASIWSDLAIGLLIAGALAAWVPDQFWHAFFLTNNPTWAAIEGPLVGPIVAMLSFVCSVGNVPLAAVLWRGGISFGGVVSFIFADLLVLPILNIYRKYYGAKMALYLLVSFYAAMVIAGYAVELLFGWLGVTPVNRSVVAISSGISWNYTSALNIVFVVIAGALLYRFFRTGGPNMLRMMAQPGGHEHPANNQAPSHHHHHGHH